VPTIRELLLARADDDGLGVLYEDQSLTHREHVAGAAARGRLLLDLRAQAGPDAGPFHVGVLLDNGPEFSMVLGGAALVGATIVGINPTRRGAELERDVRHTDCLIIVTETSHAGLLDGLDTGVPPERLFVVDTPPWGEALAPHAGLGVPDVDVDPAAPFMLFFTSGTTGQPKAAICSQQRLAGAGLVLSQMQEITSADRCYEVMPMFHSNAVMAGWSPCLAAGATHVFRRRFSASAFLDDVRRYGCTYMNYVGKPMSYILATPERPDDADNPLVRVFGNEGAEHDLARFAERFGCRVTDSYGSSEGGASVARPPDTPPGALGIGTDGTVILDPETMLEKPRARFDEHGRLLNADECVGEIANTKAAAAFEGYWNNPEADLERTRSSIYWTGDLGYRDDAGWFYFAGRNFDWIRVDGENFAAAPIERILVRHPDVLLAAVYAVPNATVGDDVMAAILLETGRGFDGEGFAAFLSQQSDLGTKSAPRYVRVVDDFPKTETNKILKRVLRHERWDCDEPVWVREGSGTGATVGYRLMTADDRTALLRDFEARGRTSVLDAS
jgi:fatty-acyl-CoA synthase